MMSTNVWIVFTTLIFNVIECSNNLNSDACLKDHDHNRDIFKKCLIPKLYEVAYLNFGNAHMTSDKFQTAICRDIGKSFKCVGYMGGFCPNQDNLGPNLLKYLNHLCSHTDDFSNFHNVIQQFISMTSEEFSSINEVIDPCLKAANQEARLEKCLTGSKQCDSSYKFMALEDSYVCVMSALQEMETFDMDELLEATELLINMLELEIGKDPFCKSKVPQANRLCKSNEEI